MDIRRFWREVLSQNKEKLREYFHKDAVIKWHCTNELFSVEEYIIANCEYPGNWDGDIERIEEGDTNIISVVRVFPTDRNTSFHVVNFMVIKEDKIVEMDEYWSDDGSAPDWRKRLKIGKTIR